jgi:hypothetical protein
MPAFFGAYAESLFILLIKEEANMPQLSQSTVRAVQ